MVATLPGNTLKQIKSRCNKQAGGKSECIQRIKRKGRPAGTKTNEIDSTRDERTPGAAIRKKREKKKKNEKKENKNI